MAEADKTRWAARTSTMADLPEHSIFKQPQLLSEADAAAATNQQLPAFDQPTAEPTVLDAIRQEKAKQNQTERQSNE